MQQITILQFQIVVISHYKLRATLINTLLWIFNFLVGLIFSISTTEISALNKAMAIYICANVTIMIRLPCMLNFCFRANTENRNLDLNEERERKRRIIIEEAKKRTDIEETKKWADFYSINVLTKKTLILRVEVKHRPIDCTDYADSGFFF